eukprot:4327033-Pyramimonas_sp.AAC.1
MLWGDKIDFGPRGQCANFCEAGWWPSRSIACFFPCAGQTAPLKADNGGCWDLLKVRGMSQITVDQR